MTFLCMLPAFVLVRITTRKQNWIHLLGYTLEHQTYVVYIMFPSHLPSIVNSLLGHSLHWEWRPADMDCRGWMTISRSANPGGASSSLTNTAGMSSWTGLLYLCWSWPHLKNMITGLAGLPCAIAQRFLAVPLQPCSNRHRRMGSHPQWQSTVIA